MVMPHPRHAHEAMSDVPPEYGSYADDPNDGTLPPVEWAHVDFRNEVDARLRRGARKMPKKWAKSKAEIWRTLCTTISALGVLYVAFVK